MDSSHYHSLPEILQNMWEWIHESQDLYERNEGKIKKKHVDKVDVPFSLLDVGILQDYVISSAVDSEFHMQQLYGELWHSDVWDCRSENRKDAEKMAITFLLGLKEVFKVPKLQRGVGSLRKNDILARFVGFLSKFLNNTKLCSSGLDDVLKQLRYFITIFWDKPFEAAEDEEDVQRLLAQFEGAVNETGRLVHASIFSPAEVIERVDQSVLETIRLLKGNIIEFLQTFPHLTTSKIGHREVDSFFIIDSLVNDLGDLLNGSNCSVVGIKEQIEKLHQLLLLSWPKAKKHLDVNEYKEIGVQIRDMAYGAEYLINSFLVGDVPLWYLTISLSNVIHHIEVTQARIQELEKNQDVRALRVAKTFSTQLSVNDGRGNEVDDIIVGIKEETEILQLLCGATKNLQMISIVGMPGLGKTTLAKKLHNHPTVCEQFDRRAWCVVSQTYRRKNLLVNILRELGEGDKSDKDEESIALQIHQTLMGRRYLITLDDIWSSKAWDDLRRLFPKNGNGSRILLTSRSNNTAPDGSTVIGLPLLSNDQCWTILKKRVFSGRDTCPPEFQRVGKEIATECKGLPLIATVLAGVLSAVDEELKMWENVAQHLKSYIGLDENKYLMNTLQLSYQHLPQHLKPCFLYLGVFKEDALIDVEKLKQVWIAEGFVHKEGGKSVQVVAEEYLRELINKSLLIAATERSDGTRAKACTMHDLLRDMCLKVAEEEKFLKVSDCNDWKDKLKFKHLVIQFPWCFLQPFGPRMRSFYSSVSPNEYLCLDDMKLLRVLDCWIAFKNDSDSLEGLENLVTFRYLNVGEMPKSIGRFVNLEYLIIPTGDVSISSEILKLHKLRYIRANRITLQPDCNVSQTSNLEYLSGFYIQNRRDERMLEYSPSLLKLKCIYLISRRVNGPPLSFDVSYLSVLESLSVSSSYSQQSSLFEIKFPCSIRKLSLQNLSFSWEKMCMIGTLPNLEVLKLGQNAFVGKRWDTREDEFARLRFLKLEYLDLCEWNVTSSEHFPNLRRLVVCHCYSLQMIPSEIGENVEYIKVVYCKDSVSRSARKIQQEQKELENNISLDIVERLMKKAAVEKVSTTTYHKEKRKKGKKLVHKKVGSKSRVDE